MSEIDTEYTNGVTSPPLPSQAGPSTPLAATSPRSSLDDAEVDIPQLKHELTVARQEKESLGNQYRSLLAKLTAMRQSLGEKLREDAVSASLLVKDILTKL